MDSNLLTYVFDKSEPEKREKCRNLIEDCWKGRKKYAVSVQNLSEFYVTVTEKVEHPIPRDVAEKFVILIIEYDGWKVMNLDDRTVLKAIEIEKEHETPYWDSQIAAVMEENGIEKILTENEEDFEGIPWIEVENPLKG
ncbi:hypothetical protein AKJ37_05325 [candidate division MSBL1 archaeon SCGC-AAA259I09]|uniref:PIN domain-containing protein n=1 Tax=candidate division MSBL1 archaeon SCGC-AAA259I09 TaxID=1698267 RepID=A0A133UQ75_9EURY|nr:hypothetical protein AKJ37_05325 [candidate division MSBL1 archaeon SCGC-AAA259I09]